MTECYGYLRVSGFGQITGDGFPRQRQSIEDFCAKNDLCIVQWFQEDGVCGETELQGRPALTSLVEAINTNGVRTVVIEKLDRLARDLMVQETIIRDFQNSGVIVYSTCEPDLCSKDPSRVLIRQVFGAIAQYDRSMIVAKLRSARQRIKAKTGKCEGRAGYSEFPEYSETVSEIRKLRETGITYREICEILEQRGIKTRSGKYFLIGQVHRICKNSENTQAA